MSHVHLGALIASSASAEVFALDGDRVLKLLRPAYPPQAAEQELQRARLAHDLGFPTPRAHGCLAHAGRAGLVFDRCDGPTWLELLRCGDPDPAARGRAFFQLQHSLHACDSEWLLPIQPRLARWIQAAPGVPEEQRLQAMSIAQAPPARWAACHGDFHPLNVIESAQGPRIIDWTGLGRGDPAIDVTRTLLYLRHGHAPDLAAAPRAAFTQAYQAACLQAWQGRLDELVRWQVPVAMGRLATPALEVGERQAVWRLAMAQDTLWSGGAAS